MSPYSFNVPEDTTTVVSCSEINAGQEQQYDDRCLGRLLRNRNEKAVSVNKYLRCFQTVIGPPCGHTGFTAEYVGEWGCTQFVQETGSARRGGGAITVKLRLLSVALVTSGNSHDWEGFRRSHLIERGACAAIRHIPYNGRWQTPAREPALFARNATTKSRAPTH